MKLIKSIKFNSYTTVDFLLNHTGRTLKVRIKSVIILPRERYLSHCFPVKDFTPESILESPEFQKVIKQYQ